MIVISAERCTGCGACLDVCPTGALFLVDGRAMVDTQLCRDCEACLAACSTGAIAAAEGQEPVTESIRVPALRPEPQVVQVSRGPALVPCQSRMLPAVGAALAWAGREILPWLADSVLAALDRRENRLAAKGAARCRNTRGAGARGGGRRHRHRQRATSWPTQEKPPS